MSHSYVCLGGGSLPPKSQSESFVLLETTLPSPSLETGGCVALSANVLLFLIARLSQAK